MPLEETIKRLSAEMCRLGTGPLAELRRMETGGPGVTGYWHLASRCSFLDADANTWMRIVKIMAILTPKGEHAVARPVHALERRFGAVLCDGGDPRWSTQGGEARPLISETRLARFLSQRPDQRAETLGRFARMLAAKRDPASGINCADIARLLLFPDNKSGPQDLARAYYRRLDSAAHKASQEENA
jgi:CRISPR system Cascade subunit CasB